MLVVKFISYMSSLEERLRVTFNFTKRVTAKPLDFVLTAVSTIPDAVRLPVVLRACQQVLEDMLLEKEESLKTESLEDAMRSYVLLCTEAFNAKKLHSEMGKHWTTPGSRYWRGYLWNERR